jgi:hypothetical protein
MQPQFRGLIMGLLSLSVGARAQMPTGFHWVNFKQEPDTVARIAKVLQAENYSAIREIGVVADFALVLTTEREPEWTTPEGDMWTVYSISMEAAEFRKLLSGYNLRMVTWLKFVPGHDGDLGITYLDCYECEAATLFTAFHFRRKEGWQARWPSKEPDHLPGILFMSSDAGVPYTDDDVDQVWAVMSPASGLASIGTWYHSRDLKTGKVTSVATKFSVGFAGEEKSTALNGTAATLWERTLCKPADAVPSLMGGQDSKSCKNLFQHRALPKKQ